MPLTSAERLKLLSERTKNNPEEYGAYLQKERERYNKRKEIFLIFFQQTILR